MQHAKHLPTKAIARRTWRQHERWIILHGLIGRLSIAIEPLICAVIFTAIAVIPFRLPRPEINVIGAPAQFTLAQVIAPIFALAAIAFLVYAILVLLAPIHAFVKTFTPLYVVDGYIRYRSDESSAAHFIAALDHDGNILHEWELAHQTQIPSGTYPAFIEFSRFGGIHRIDGHETGILPKTFMPFGIGNAVMQSGFEQY